MCPGNTGSLEDFNISYCTIKTPEFHVSWPAIETHYFLVISLSLLRLVSLLSLQTLQLLLGHGLEYYATLTCFSAPRCLSGYPVI